MSLFSPKFLTKNKITSATLLSDSASTSVGNRTKLIDRNDAYQYLSVGATTGTRTITWTPSAATSINRIFIQGINFDTFTIKYNTSSTFSTPITFTGNTRTNLYFEFNAVSVTNVVISVSATMTASDVIRITEFYCGTELYEMIGIGGTTQIIPAQKASVLTLADGTTYKSVDRLNIRAVDFSLLGVSEADKASFKAVFDYNATAPFVFIPFPATSSDNWDGKADHYNWVSGFDFENYTENVDLNGYDGNFSIVQAGGIG